MHNNMRSYYMLLLLLMMVQHQSLVFQQPGAIRLCVIHECVRVLCVCVFPRCELKCVIVCVGMPMPMRMDVNLVFVVMQN